MVKCSYCAFYAQEGAVLPSGAINPTRDHLTSHPVEAVAIPHDVLESTWYEDVGLVGTSGYALHPGLPSH